MYQGDQATLDASHPFAGHAPPSWTGRNPLATIASRVNARARAQAWRFPLALLVTASGCTAALFATHGTLASVAGLLTLPFLASGERARSRTEAMAAIASDPAQDALGVLASGPAPMLLVDSEGFIAASSREAARLLGQDALRIAGHPIRALLPDAPPDWLDAISSGAPTPYARDMTLSGPRPGSPILVEARSAAIRVGRSRYVAVVFSDRTADRAHVEALIAARDAALARAEAARAEERHSVGELQACLAEFGAHLGALSTHTTCTDTARSLDALCGCVTRLSTSGVQQWRTDRPDLTGFALPAHTEMHGRDEGLPIVDLPESLSPDEIERHVRDAVNRSLVRAPEPVFAAGGTRSTAPRIAEPA